MNDTRYAQIDLHQFCVACLVGAGVPTSDADWTSHVLLQADLQARPSHGISRLSAYIHGIERGKIQPTPNIQMIRTGISSGMLNGDNGLGPVVAKLGMGHAMSYAKETGVGVVTVRGGNHAGSMGAYTAMAADEGLIAIGLTNAQPALPPWGGRTAFFGTNPIAMSAGQGDGQVTIDLATSIVARGNIMMAAKAGEPIPEGWAIDAMGAPTTDAKAALSGALLPMAGPKGYSLALLVEILCGVLSGASVGPDVGSIYDDREGAPGTGMFFLALDPERFVGAHHFTERLLEMEKAIHESPRADGTSAIYLPGERRRQIVKERLQLGIPLEPEIRQELVELGVRLGVPFSATASSS